MPTIEFCEPYFTNAIRNYVSVPFPTGETVNLIDDDGQCIASVTEAGSRWPELLMFAANARGYEFTLAEIESLETTEYFAAEHFA
jgi:hypothetical protein